jgi:hypothetical protein
VNKRERVYVESMIEQALSYQNDIYFSYDESDFSMRITVSPKSEPLPGQVIVSEAQESALREVRDKCIPLTWRVVLEVPGVDNINRFVI